MHTKYSAHTETRNYIKLCAELTDSVQHEKKKKCNLSQNRFLKMSLLIRSQYVNVTVPDTTRSISHDSSLTKSSSSDYSHSLPCHCCHCLCLSFFTMFAYFWTMFGFLCFRQLLFGWFDLQQELNTKKFWWIKCYLKSAKSPVPV